MLREIWLIVEKANEIKGFRAMLACKAAKYWVLS